MSGIPNKMLPVAVEMLPEGYRRLEYLESTGTQWIDTGIKLQITDDIKCRYYAKEVSSSSLIFGTYTAPLIAYFSQIGGTFKSSQFWWGELGGQTALQFTNISPEQIIDVIVSNKTIQVNNVIKSIVAEDFETIESCKLFSYRRQFPSSSRIYSFSIGRKGQLQLNLIPCLDDKGKPCMFDTVSHKPLYNKGTGEFVYRLPGDGELPAGYTRMEYIESTGTQYIDTGIKLSSESVIECSAALVNDSLSSIAVCGSYSDPDKYALFWHLSKQEGEDAPIGQFQETVWFSSTTIAEVGKVYRFKQTPGELWIDDELARARDVNDFSLDFSAALFGTGHSLGYFAYKSASRIYSFSISLNDQLQLNFIPCLDDKGVPCMFDTVTRRPFRNAATTGPDFLYG